jgi:hypothetical protein
MFFLHVKWLHKLRSVIIFEVSSNTRGVIKLVSLSDLKKKATFPQLLVIAKPAFNVLTLL